MGHYIAQRKVLEINVKLVSLQRAVPWRLTVTTESSMLNH